MEFARSKKGIFISERKYILDLLSEMGLLGCKVVKTPIEVLFLESLVSTLKFCTKHQSVPNLVSA